MSTRILSALPAICLLLAACASPALQGLQVTDVWGRSSPEMATVGAFYMNIQNQTSQADQLMSARSDACGTVELHTVVTGADGMMEMQPVESIEVPASGLAELKPGGFHVMCIDLKDNFKVGAKIDLTLVFAQAGEVNVQVDIRDQ